jgi:hypothetical protein
MTIKINNSKPQRKKTPNEKGNQGSEPRRSKAQSQRGVV